MFEREKLRRAVLLQKRAYEFVKWYYESAVAKGIMSAKMAREHAEATQVLAAGLKERFVDIPSDCRPLSQGDEDIQSFVNMLSSYLSASFDLVENPGTRGTKVDDYCEACGAYLLAAPHLRPKKLSRHDKMKARKLKLTCLKRLAQDAGLVLSDQAAETLVDAPEMREAIAMTTYGEQLLFRMDGQVEGPAVLALWREFAWNSTGSPKKGFKLDADDILRSQETALNAISCLEGA